MACKYKEQVSTKPALSEDIILIEKIQDILRKCTRKIIKLGDKLPFKNGTVDVIISGGITLSRLQNTAKTIIEFQTLECGQLFSHPCTDNTKYSQNLTLEKFKTWYDNGWISLELFESWTSIINNNDKVELERLTDEIQRVGKIIWSLDEIIQGTKNIGTTVIDLQARLHTGLSILRFLVACGEDEVIALRLEVRTHVRSPTILTRII